MSWTEERVAKLSKLWADGLSASQIAAELGGVTRNAVIGKVHRIGLSGRAKPAASTVKHTKRNTKTKAYNTQTRKMGGQIAVQRAHAEKPSIVTDIPKPESKRLELVQLTEKSCKWPEGDPQTSDFHFCGHTVKEDAPYCEYHCKMAYQLPIDRRREKRTATA